MKTIQNVARQGDVMLMRIDKIPSTKKAPHAILALGEVTGHMHKVLPQKGTTLSFVQDGSTTYLEIKGGDAVLYHGSDSQIATQINDLEKFDNVVEDTHAPIVLTPGFYKTWIQREYDPQEYSRLVCD